MTIAGAATAVMAAAGLLLAGAPAAFAADGAPGAAATARVNVSATTRIVNAGVPGNGGAWAGDQVTRVATIAGGTPVAASYCGRASGPCYRYTAGVRDRGEFRTLRGALTPNQSVPGRRIFAIVTGAVTGSVQFGPFYAAGLPQAALVPSTAANAFYATSWPALFFPRGTAIAGLQVGPWAVRYQAATGCGQQDWTDASANGFGDLPSDGNITGCRARAKQGSRGVTAPSL